MDNGLTIHVAACILVQDAEGKSEPLCGFVEDKSGRLSLPTKQVTEDMYAAESIIALLKETIDANLMLLDIVSCGFFDPVYSKCDKANRKIYLCYKTNIRPGTAVSEELKFLSPSAVKIAKKRIETGHHETYKFGANI